MTAERLIAGQGSAKEWQRARKPDQRKKRRQDILHAAYRLFRDEDFSGISLNSIAREAQLSKTSIYLYFKTREEIFLHIYMNAFRDWISHSVTALKRLQSGSTAGIIAETWIDVLWNDEKMCSLSPLVNASIEHNVSDGLLADVVRMKLDESKRLHMALKRFLPYLSERNAYELLLYTINLFSQFIANEKNKQLLWVLGNDEFSGKGIHIRKLYIDGVSRLIFSYGMQYEDSDSDSDIDPDHNNNKQ